MSAVANLDRLLERIAREKMRVEGLLAARERAISEHNAWVAQSLDIEARTRAELDDLIARLPAAQAAADEEQRRAHRANMEKELDGLLEVDRREQDRRERISALQSDLGRDAASGPT